MASRTCLRESVVRVYVQYVDSLYGKFRVLYRTYPLYGTLFFRTVRFPNHIGVLLERYGTVSQLWWRCSGEIFSLFHHCSFVGFGHSPMDREDLGLQ
jgi:hypothetical protein